MKVFKQRKSNMRFVLQTASPALVWQWVGEGCLEVRSPVGSS